MSAPAAAHPYEELDSIYTAMLDAIRRLDWEGAVILQQQAEAVVDRIRRLPGDPPGRANRDKADAIAKILATQEIIKGEVTDWQDDLRPLLSAFKPR